MISSHINRLERLKGFWNGCGTVKTNQPFHKKKVSFPEVERVIFAGTVDAESTVP